MRSPGTDETRSRCRAPRPGPNKTACNPPSANQPRPWSASHRQRSGKRDGMAIQLQTIVPECIRPILQCRPAAPMGRTPPIRRSMSGGVCQRIGGPGHAPVGRLGLCLLRSIRISQGDRGGGCVMKHNTNWPKDWRSGQDRPVMPAQARYSRFSQAAAMEGVDGGPAAAMAGLRCW